VGSILDELEAAMFADEMGGAAGGAGGGGVPPSRDPGVAVHMRNVTKTYLLGIEGVPALRGVSVTIRRGEFVVILGKSGGGKTSLLNVVGTIDKPTRGDLYLCGRRVDAKTTDAELADIRLRQLGFVFQVCVSEGRWGGGGGGRCGWGRGGVCGGHMGGGWGGPTRAPLHPPPPPPARRRSTCCQTFQRWKTWSCQWCWRAGAPPPPAASAPSAC
jgi:hypothetical protein